MRQFTEKKKVLYHELAQKELNAFPDNVVQKVKFYVSILKRDGYLEYPVGKRLSDKLFEIRIKLEGAWRIIYAYIEDDSIVVLHAFNKKSQKTPSQNLETAKKRLNNIQLS